MSQESPIYTWHDWTVDEGFFNWTLTYRLDSDVPTPYADVRERTSGKIIGPSNRLHWLSADSQFNDSAMMKHVTAKTNKVVWFVSNCNARSKRDKLANRLQEYLPVHIYGKCGNYSCPRSQKVELADDPCYDTLNSYKFYLSFENSLCADYVTEKLFNAMNNFVIPVVFGGADYSKFAPPKSFINANDFETVERLAAYLRYLDENDQEYVKYFWWKEYYVVETARRFNRFCNLCQKLHEPGIDLEVKTYSQLHEWWFGSKFQPKCKSSRIHF